MPKSNLKHVKTFELKAHLKASPNPPTHFCNARMARGETPSEKHSIQNSFEIIPTAPMGPRAPKAPSPGPRGPEGALRCVKAGPGPPRGPFFGVPGVPPTPGARPGLLGIVETALRQNCAASKLRCEETALRANGSAGMRGA